MNEVFRRVDSMGRTMGEFVREEVCGALGIPGDFVIGATKEEAENNFASLTGLSTSSILLQMTLPSFLRLNGIEVNANISLNNECWLFKLIKLINLIIYLNWIGLN